MPRLPTYQPLDVLKHVDDVSFAEQANRDISNLIFGHQAQQDIESLTHLPALSIGRPGTTPTQAPSIEQPQAPESDLPIASGSPPQPMTLPSLPQEDTPSTSQNADTSGSSAFTVDLPSSAPTLTTAGQSGPPSTQPPANTPSPMPTGPASQGQTAPAAQSGAFASNDERLAYVADSALRHGHDPKTAQTVARSEGAGPAGPVGDNGLSFGAFQAYTGGGQGNEFQKETGLDPRDLNNERALIDWQMAKLDKTGWTPFHGAARVGVGTWEGIGTTRGQPPAGAIPGPEQSPNGTPISAPAQPGATSRAPAPTAAPPADDIAQAALDDPDKWALCGPVAAVIAAQQRGQNWTVGQAKKLAQTGSLWDAGAGMHGLATEVTLLNQMGLPAKVGPAEQQRLAQDAQNGNTPIISTNKHYFVLKGYDPETGRFDTTTTGTALQGGSRWLTLDQISTMGNGIQGAAYFDNPASPTPSVVAGSTDASSITSPRPDASGTATSVTAPTVALTTDDTGTTSAQPTMYRQPLQPTPGADTTPIEDASSPPGASVPGAPPWEQNPSTAPGVGIPPVRDDYATAGSSVPAAVPSAQAIPQEDPTTIPRPAYVPPAMPIMATPPPPEPGLTPPPSPYDQQQAASMEPAPDRFTAPPESPLKPVWDAGGQVIGYVHSGLERAVSAIPVPSTEHVVQNISNIASGEPLQPSTPASAGLQQSARDITTAVQEPIKAALEAVGIDPAAALQAAQDASNVLGPGGAAVGMVRRGAGRAANVAREAADVLPEGARAIAPTEAQDVARLQLDKFPPELRGVIQDAAASTDFAHTQRRGVLPDVAAEGLADDITRSVDQWIKQGKAGKVLNTEETRALRNVMTGQAQKVADLAQQVTEADSAGVATNLLIVQAHAEAEKLAGLVQYVEGARAEAGRSLRAWRAEPRPTDPNAAAQQIFKKFGTGPEARQRAIDALGEFQQIPKDDPIAQANFWARIERGNITSTDVLTAIRYNSMLSSPRTWEVGWIGSMLQAPFKAASDVLAATTRPTSGELPLAARGAVVGFQRGLRPLLETITQGITSEQAAGGAIPRGLAPRTTSALGRAVGTAIDLPGRMTAAPDALFSSIFREAELGRQAGIQAYRQGLTGEERSQFLLDFLTHPPKSADEQITRTVDRMMLRGDMGTFGNVVQSFGRNVPGGEFYKSLILPFMKVAYHVWTQGVEMTPVGAVGTALDVGRGALGRGPYAAGFGAEQAASHVRPLAERLRYNAMGLGVTGFALGQAYAGNISAAGPADPGQKAMLRSQGWQPYSVKVGGTWYGYSNWGPVAVPLASAAAIAENQQYRKPDATPEKDMLDMTARVGKLVGDQSFISGIGTLVNAYQEPDRYLPQFLANMATSFVPYGSALNVAGQATDPTQRRPDRVADVGPTEFGKQAVEARLPGLRQSVPAAQDVLGRPIPNDQTGASALEPFRFSNQRADPTIQAFTTAGVNIPAPHQQIVMSGAKLDLTPAEQRRWNEVRGEMLIRLAGPVAQSGALNRMPPVTRERMLQSYLSTAAQQADTRVFAEMPDRAQRLRDAISAKLRPAS
jgi:hypothetical protein